MATKVKNPEWIEFKKVFIEMVNLLNHEFERFDISAEDGNFDLKVEENAVHPIFIKNANELKVQYDFTLCNTKVRLLTLSRFKDAWRIEVMLKNDVNINLPM